MDLDVVRARRDTRGASQVAQRNDAGAAPPLTQVTEAVVADVRRESGTGGHEAAAAAAERVEATHAATARLIRCEGAEVADVGAVENATPAWDTASSAMAIEGS